VLNPAGQQLAAIDIGELSLSLLSENKGQRVANCVRTDNTSHPYVSRDSTNIQQLVEFIGRFSAKMVHW
jgi:hypothetical protein